MAATIVTHVAPLGWENIGLTGDYVWTDTDSRNDSCAFLPTPTTEATSLATPDHAKSGRTGSSTETSSHRAYPWRRRKLLLSSSDFENSRWSERSLKGQP